MRRISIYNVAGGLMVAVGLCLAFFGEAYTAEGVFPSPTLMVALRLLLIGGVLMTSRRAAGLIAGFLVAVSGVIWGPAIVWKNVFIVLSPLLLGLLMVRLWALSWIRRHEKVWYYDVLTGEAPHYNEAISKLQFKWWRSGGPEPYHLTVDSRRLGLVLLALGYRRSPPQALRQRRVAVKK